MTRHDGGSGVSPVSGRGTHRGVLSGVGSHPYDTKVTHYLFLCCVFITRQYVHVFSPVIWSPGPATHIPPAREALRGPCHRTRSRHSALRRAKQNATTHRCYGTWFDQTTPTVDDCLVPLVEFSPDPGLIVIPRFDTAQVDDLRLRHQTIVRHVFVRNSKYASGLELWLCLRLDRVNGSLHERNRQNALSVEGNNGRRTQITRAPARAPCARLRVGSRRASRGCSDPLSNRSSYRRRDG